jgi:hypothetical protein
MDTNTEEQTKLKIITSIISSTDISLLENTLSMVLQAIKPTISSKNLESLIKEFMSVKDKYFSDPTSIIDENKLFATTVLLLSAGGRYSELENTMNIDI